jgi:hypothetical protein
MKTPEPNSSLKWNTVLWLFAMILPAVFNIAFASTKFPWHIVLPLVLVGPMLASNKMVSRAAAKPADPGETD